MKSLGGVDLTAATPSPRIRKAFRNAAPPVTATANLKSISRTTLLRWVDPAYFPVMTRAGLVMATCADMGEHPAQGPTGWSLVLEVDEAIRLQKPLGRFCREVRKKQPRWDKPI
jgi:hypothetical protein